MSEEAIGCAQANEGEGVREIPLVCAE